MRCKKCKLIKKNLKNGLCFPCSPQELIEHIGKHIVLEDDTAEKLNIYCEKNFIIKKKLVNKIVLDFLEGVSNE